MRLVNYSKNGKVLFCNKVACAYFCSMPFKKSIALVKKINWDALGIATSVACAIHCALLPLILTSLPLFGVNIIKSLKFEFCMILLAFFIGTFSLYHGWKKHHHRWLPFIVFVTGMISLFSKELWHRYELFFLISAVTLIITAHFLNYRFCRAHNHAHKDDCYH